MPNNNGLFPSTPGLPITSPYGWRKHPGTGLDEFHAGIDIGGQGFPRPIYATQSGQVIVNQWSNTGGWMVYLQHTGDSYFSRYLHLESQSPIGVGQTVTRGQNIGTMGNTGDSSGIHLHFEVATSQAGFGTEAGTIDPEQYIGGTVPDPDPPEQEEIPYFIRNRHNTNMRRMGVRGRR